MVFLYPSVFAVNYLYVSLLIGAAGFYGNKIVVPYMASYSLSWDASVGSMLFFGGVVAAILLFSDYKAPQVFWLERRQHVGGILLSLLGFFFALLVFADGEIFFAEQIIGAVFAVYVLQVLAVKQPSTRIVLYLLAFIPFALAMAHSKREAIFFLYSILVFEVILAKRRQLTLSRVSLALSGAVVLGFLVLIMTVVRASAIFGVSGISNILPAVAAYLEWHDFWGYFLLNIEATYTYFHVVNAIDMSSKGLVPLLWGETYAKLFYIWLPRELGLWKPDSAVHYYTTLFSYDVRREGGSWGVSMLGEAYMNFRFAGAIVVAGLLSGFDWIFRNFILRPRGRGLLYSVGALYFGVAVLTFARGSGLELAFIQWVVTIAAALPFAIVLGFGKRVTALWRRSGTFEARRVLSEASRASSRSITTSLYRSERSERGSRGA
ncbi:hypothetical protein [uncultured Parvibaculum sp.]|uniref:hypothetical protein n=1 Tax=uncultured Parvibaculum sp. TaxID=291828 RepID=UPI0030DB78F5